MKNDGGVVYIQFFCYCSNVGVSRTDLAICRSSNDNKSDTISTLYLNKLQAAYSYFSFLAAGNRCTLYQNALSAINKNKCQSTLNSYI